MPKFWKIPGVPFFEKKPLNSDFNFIIDNLRKKMAGWKTKFLNLAGRTTLVKACLNSIPTYVMTYVKLPKHITKKIYQIQCNFIWGTTSEKRRIHLLNWQTITLLKDLGGIGIKKSSHKYMALLRKLAWKTFNGSPNLWSPVLLSKYGHGANSQLSEEDLKPNRYSSRTRKSILEAWKICKKYS